MAEVMVLSGGASGKPGGWDLRLSRRAPTSLQTVSWCLESGREHLEEVNTTGTVIMTSTPRDYAE